MVGSYPNLQILKRLKVTNTLAYYGVELMMAVKGFIVKAPGQYSQNLLTKILQSFLT